MTDKTDKKIKLDAIMAKLKVTYMQEFPDKIAGMEELVLDLENSSRFVESYQKLFRDVHSMKGSGGTFGFSIITTICHQMEDLLKEEGEENLSFSSASIDGLLKYTDLLQKIPECYHSGDTNLASIQEALNNLKETRVGNIPRCLVVEGSATTQTMVSLVLAEEEVEISLADSGYQALERLLQEEFDLLITGMAIGELNGKALIAAMRLSDSANADIPVILLTSSDTSPDIVPLSANTVIHKGPDMPASLLEAYHKLV